MYDKDGLHGLDCLLDILARYCQLCCSVKCENLFEATYVRTDQSTEMAVDLQPYRVHVALADCGMRHANTSGRIPPDCVDYESLSRVIE